MKTTTSFLAAALLTAFNVSASAQEAAVAPAPAVPAMKPEVVSYEKNIELVGTVEMVKTKQGVFDQVSYVLKLNKPISVTKNVSYENKAEENITEVLLLSGDAQKLKQIAATSGQAVAATGRLFHGFNNSHTKPIVMDIREIGVRK